MNANPHLSDDPIVRDSVVRETDHTIDRALAALRDAQPRSGLESRILASLEHRTVSSATNPGGLPFHEGKGWGIVCGSKRENARWFAHPALWTAASAAVLAIASLIILHRHVTPNEIAHTPQSSPGLTTAPGLAAGFSPLNTPATTKGALAPARATSHPALISRHPERSAQALSRRTPVFENCPDHHTGCATHDDDITNGVTPTDAQLLADLHAPSHPAPPLPLTSQEKLFLRMLRYGNATQIAELNPIVRAKQDADETAAFKAFFPDPPPLKQPGDAE